MPAGVQDLTGDFTLVANATYDVTLTLLDQDTGDPIDLSPYDSVRAQFRETDSSSVLILDVKDITNIVGVTSDGGGFVYPSTGVEILDPPTTGQIRMHIDAAALQFIVDQVDLGATGFALAGVYDILAYTANVQAYTATPPAPEPTGAAPYDSLQTKTWKGAWALERTVTQQVP